MFFKQKSGHLWDTISAVQNCSDHSERTKIVSHLYDHYRTFSLSQHEIASYLSNHSLLPCTSVMSTDDVDQQNKLAGILYLFAQSLFIIYCGLDRHCSRHWLMLYVCGWLATLLGNFTHPSSNRTNDQFQILVSIQHLLNLLHVRA